VTTRSTRWQAPARNPARPEDVVSSVCDHRRPLRVGLRWLALALAAALVALAVAAPAAAAPPTAADRELLAASDLGGALPTAFRSEVKVEPLAGSGAGSFEVWRDGNLALLRFLDPKQNGKAFLQRPEGTWLLARGARPVKLGTASRLAAGVSLQELVGLSFAHDFTLEDVTRQGTGAAELVTFALRAKRADLPYPRASYVVRAGAKRPVRIDYRLANGRVARVVEISDWRPGSRLIPAVTVAKDLVGGRPPVRVRLVALDERQPPPHLFELTPAGDAARAALARR
jgi:hypothetical protein